MFKLIYLTAFLLLLQTSSAKAEDSFFSGYRLVSIMLESEKADRNEPDTNWVDEGVYIGYVIGVYHSHRGDICSSNMEIDKMLAVVTRYLKEHPSEWKNPPEILVLSALKIAFPCR